eukprot:scaffold6501_cov98-Cylindrotheca_fusiformis.AAC.3
MDADFEAFKKHLQRLLEIAAGMNNHESDFVGMEDSSCKDGKVGDCLDQKNMSLEPRDSPPSSGAKERSSCQSRSIRG